MITVNIHEAKARLSELIHAVEHGETIHICRRNEPVAQVTHIEKTPKKKRVFGLHEGLFHVPDGFFEPLPEEELALWNDPKIFPDETSGKP